MNSKENIQILMGPPVRFFQLSALYATEGWYGIISGYGTIGPYHELKDASAAAEVTVAEFAPEALAQRGNGPRSARPHPRLRAFVLG